MTRFPTPGERVRILFVVGNFVAGGAERHLLEMWRRIDRTRFEVQIACFRREGQFLPDVDALGLPVHDLRVGRRIYDPSGVAGFFRLPFVVHNDKKVKPQKGVQAFYLGDNGDFIPIQQNETSLGYATVRVEVGF